jgi:hypothetical protein
MNTQEQCSPAASLETLRIQAQARRSNLLQPQYDPVQVYMTFQDIFIVAERNKVFSNKISKLQADRRRLENSNITGTAILGDKPNADGTTSRITLETRSTYTAIPDEITDLTEKLLIDETEEVLIRLRFNATPAANFKWKMVEVADKLYHQGQHNFELLFYASFTETYIELIKIFADTRPDLLPALAASFKVAATDGIRVCISFLSTLFKEVKSMSVPEQRHVVRAKIRAALAPFQFQRVHTYTESSKAIGQAPQKYLEQHQQTTSRNPVEAYVVQCPFNGFAKYLIEQSITAFEAILTQHLTNYSELSFDIAAVTDSISAQERAVPVEEKIANFVEELFIAQNYLEQKKAIYSEPE